MAQASRRVFVVGAFCSPHHHHIEEPDPVVLRSLTQLHSYRGRQDGVLRSDAESACLSLGLCGAAKSTRFGFVADWRSGSTLAIATDAVRTPTTRVHQSGGIAEAGTRAAREGSIPSSSTEQHSGAPLVNNDRVVQRRRAGRRCNNRPALPSLLIKAQHAESPRLS